MPAGSVRAEAKTILIAGPTASGKSAVALALADRLGGTIINADSMQLYRELRLLTARPSEADEAVAPHRLYGTVSANDAFSVGRWLEAAQAAIAEATGGGSVPILVGGTGLYFKALIEGLAPVPDIPREVRAYWREQAARLNAEALHRELAARDPGVAAKLKPNDPQRIVRALEVIDATGVSLSEWQGTPAAPVLDAQTVTRLVIAPEREPLYAAIDARFDRMIENGAIEEVETLLAQGLDDSLPAMRAHGVRELRSYLAGACSLEDAKIKSKTESRRYAKRQMTWARRYMADWDWFPGPQEAVGAVVLTP
ncbi:MAG TPA: tRNA (adenosine(37)-N6)-dimethylallyltransferase MiaA [Methyloceanibacter sp.]|nr:tRNA (adenosine(37)-N6)-dimethylallyltransferase MiaA [Methyloceanibacter sp.]